MSHKTQRIRERLDAVRTLYEDGCIGAQLGHLYPDSDYDDFTIYYYDTLQVNVPSRGKEGERELDAVRDFLNHAPKDIADLLAENEHLRVKLKRAGKRVCKLVHQRGTT